MVFSDTATDADKDTDIYADMYTDIYNNTLTDTDIYTTADTLHADYLIFILKSNSSQTWSIIKSCFGAIDSRTIALKIHLENDL